MPMSVDALMKGLKYFIYNIMSWLVCWYWYISYAVTFSAGYCPMLVSPCHALKNIFYQLWHLKVLLASPNTWNPSVARLYLHAVRPKNFLLSAEDANRVKECYQVCFPSVSVTGAPNQYPQVLH